MHHLKRLLKYIKYLITAKSANSIHSPFVFDLYTNLIKEQNSFYVFDKIEDLRLILKNDKRKIPVTDLGAKKPGCSHRKQLKKIRYIVRNAASRPAYGQLLFRLVNKFRPKNILELGTSLGLGTLYLASPDSKSKVITLEGCPEIANAASHNFQKLRIKNIEQVVGNFDETLPLTLEKCTKTKVISKENNFSGDIDFVFFDGNHRKEATLNYFELCLKKSKSETIFVFDDIHWSDEMDEAWMEIKKNSAVKVTIDLFFFGIVFFRKELTKQDFILRF